MSPLVEPEAVWGQALAEGRLSHAYLLVGEGAGPLAREFLLRLFCGRGCRRCAACRKVLQGTHPDVQWITKSGRNIGIDQVRRLQKDARYRPLEAPRKAYVIEGAEDLSLEAANSLLKILEAPPPYVIFLLLARSLRLLPTIISRCQVLRLTALSSPQLREEFKKRGLGEAEIDYLLALGRGAPQRLARLLSSEDETSHPLERRTRARSRLQGLSGPKIVEFLSQAEGLIEEREATMELLKRAAALKPHELLETAQALSKLDQDKLESFLQEALRWVRDLLVIRRERGQVFNADQIDEIEERRASLEEARLISALRSLERAQEALLGNANKQLLMESVLFRLADV